MANPVLPNSPPQHRLDLPRAQECHVQEEEEKPWHSRIVGRVTIVVLLLVISMGLGRFLQIMIPCALHNENNGVDVDVDVDQPGDDPASNSNPSSSQIPTMAPTTILQEHILDLLPEYTVEPILLGEEFAAANESNVTWLTSNISSPQHQAMELAIAGSKFGNISELENQQRFYLASLYYATGGLTHWYNNTHWISYQHHECRWWSRPSYGLETDMEEFNITYFQFDTNYTNPCQEDLINSNHSKNDDDRFLKHLWLHGNDLQGTLPLELSGLSHLRSIAVAANMLSRALPSQLGLLANLQHLDVAHNQFTGSLPSEVGMATKLSYCSPLANRSDCKIIKVWPAPFPLRRGPWCISIFPTLSFQGLLCAVQAYASDPDYGPGYGLSFDCGATLCGCDCNCKSNATTGT